MHTDCKATADYPDNGSSTLEVYWIRSCWWLWSLFYTFFSFLTPFLAVSSVKALVTSWKRPRPKFQSKEKVSKGNAPVLCYISLYKLQSLCRLHRIKLAWIKSPLFALNFHEFIAHGLYHHLGLPCGCSQLCLLQKVIHFPSAASCYQLRFPQVTNWPSRWREGLSLLWAVRVDKIWGVKPRSYGLMARTHLVLNIWTSFYSRTVVRQNISAVWESQYLEGDVKLQSWPQKAHRS